MWSLERGELGLLKGRTIIYSSIENEKKVYAKGIISHDIATSRTKSCFEEVEENEAIKNINSFDKIFVGTALIKNAAFNLISLAADMYVTHVIDQIMHFPRLSKGLYNTFTPPELSEIVLETYVKPLCELRKKRSSHYKLLKSEFITFFIGAPYIGELESLFTIIENRKLFADFDEIVNVYAKKINAIASEDYTSARKFSDEIIRRTKLIRQ